MTFLAHPFRNDGAMKLFGADFSDRYSTQEDIPWVDKMADEIAAHLPRMQKEHPDRREFWVWFCGEVESMLRHVAQDQDRIYAKERLNVTLEDAGIAERFELTPYAVDPMCIEHLPPEKSEPPGKT
jgi:hypothetical protein